MGYNLFLDDERKPIYFRDYYGDESIYESEDWVICRSFDEFYQTIKENGIPKVVSFDYQPKSDTTGLDCAKLLKFFCDEDSVEIPTYYVHSNWPGIYQEFKKILG